MHMIDSFNNLDNKTSEGDEAQPRSSATPEIIVAVVVFVSVAIVIVVLMNMCRHTDQLRSWTIARAEFHPSCRPQSYDHTLRLRNSSPFGESTVELVHENDEMINGQFPVLDISKSFYDISDDGDDIIHYNGVSLEDISSKPNIWFVVNHRANLNPSTSGAAENNRETPPARKAKSIPNVYYQCKSKYDQGMSASAEAIPERDQITPESNQATSTSNQTMSASYQPPSESDQAMSESNQTTYESNDAISERNQATLEMNHAMSEGNQVSSESNHAASESKQDMSVNEQTALTKESMLAKEQETYARE